jgi:F-BAR domain only protein
MANQLRMQGQTSGINRVQGSVRGRRDVRNTMFVPAGVDVFAQSGLPAPPQSPPLPSSNSTTELASPIQPPRQKSILEDHPIGSDAGSIHSSHSLAMPGAHPELHEPGLNVSIVETVNSWFNETGITKSMVTGEIALAYNGSTTTNTEVIRLQHFELLEKVAANPTFVSSFNSNNTTASAEDAAGTYTIALANIKKAYPTVGLKYQLHLEPDNMAAYSPILLTPAWQLIDGQASVILLYSLNPAFATSGPVVFRNVAISVSLDVSGSDPIKPTAAMMHPTAGASFRRKAGTVTWRFNELSVKPEGQERLLVRFTSASGIPKKGGIELKFELPGRTGSQVGVQRRGAPQQKEKDPFADEDVEKVESREDGAWVDVEGRRVLVSGRYSAS